MKYKIGDTVKIKSIDWYCDNKDSFGKVVLSDTTFICDMVRYCGMFAKIIAIKDVVKGTVYSIDIDKGYWSWTDEMFEGMNTKEIVLPEGWEVDKIENGKIVLKESKKELPDTWEECCGLLNKGEYINNCSQIHTTLLDRLLTCDYKNRLPVGLGKPMLALSQLLICREVYRDGWKPDWNDDNIEKYCITSYPDGFHIDIHRTEAHIFVFKSEKMAKLFLGNFRTLLEQIKGIL